MLADRSPPTMVASRIIPLVTTPTPAEVISVPLAAVGIVIVVDAVGSVDMFIRRPPPCFKSLENKGGSSCEVVSVKLWSAQKSRKQGGSSCEVGSSYKHFH